MVGKHISFSLFFFFFFAHVLQHYALGSGEPPCSGVGADEACDANVSLLQVDLSTPFRAALDIDGAQTPDEFTTSAAEAACATALDCAGCQHGCYDGICYSSLGNTQECDGKKNGDELEAGFWCWDGRRDFMCKAQKSDIELPKTFTTSDLEAKCTTTLDCAGCEHGCHDGICYSTLGHTEECDGKKNGDGLGPGFWCWDGRRDFMCKAQAMPEESSNPDEGYIEEEYDDDENVEPEPAIPCADGIRNKQVCCAASCGSCGGKACGSRPGGRDACCGSIIKAAGKICRSSKDTACVIKLMTTPAADANTSGPAGEPSTEPSAAPSAEPVEEEEEEDVPGGEEATEDPAYKCVCGSGYTVNYDVEPWPNRFCRDKHELNWVCPAYGKDPNNGGAKYFKNKCCKYPPAGGEDPAYKCVCGSGYTVDYDVELWPNRFCRDKHELDWVCPAYAKDPNHGGAKYFKNKCCKY